LTKFKEEAKIKEDEKIEAKAALKRPPGTKVLPEEERVSTLESLNTNKKEVLKLLQ